MKVQLAETAPVPVSHDPQLLKRVLLKDADTRSNLKMLNHTAMEPGQSFRLHSHPTMEEVFYFLSGEGIFTLGEETSPVTAGDCLYVPAATVHACTNTGSEPLVFLAFGIALEPLTLS
jgi:mannose-6-phosphate isomerase-like protein (cupin superfamily)